jgi:hypothetical protein
MTCKFSLSLYISSSLLHLRQNHGAHRLGAKLYSSVERLPPCRIGSSGPPPTRAPILRLALLPKIRNEGLEGGNISFIKNFLSLFLRFQASDNQFVFTEPRTTVGHVTMEVFEAKLAKVTSSPNPELYSLGIIAAVVNGEGASFSILYAKYAANSHPPGTSFYNHISGHKTLHMILYTLIKIGSSSCSAPYSGEAVE